MLDPNLKQEWLEKVSIEKPQYIDQYDMSLRKTKVNTDYYYAPEEVKNDKDVALTALLKGGEILSIMPKEFKNDKEFILSLLDSGYEQHIYNHLGNNISDDPELFERCLDKGELNHIYHVPYLIKENRDLLVKILPKHDLYRKFEEQYKLDSEIVGLDLLHHNPGSYHRAYKSVKNKLSKDKKFVTSFLKKNPEFYSTMIISDKLKSDLDVIDIALTFDPTFVRYLPHELLHDKAFMSYALPKYKCPLNYCTEELREDYDLVKLNVTNNGKNLKLSQKWRYNRDLAELALQTYHDIDLLYPELIEDKGLVIKALNANPENCQTLLHFTKYYSHDLDIATIASNYKPELISSFTLLENSELNKIAAEKAQNIELLTPEQLKNRELVLTMIKINPINAAKLIAIDKTYKNDYEVVKLGLSYKVQLLTDSPILKANKELVKYAMEEHNFNNPALVDSELLLDKEMALLFIQKDIRNYVELPLSMKNNPEIYDLAIRFLDPKNTFDKWTRVNSLFTSTMELKHLYELIVDNSSLSKDYDFHIRLVEVNPFFYTILGENNSFISDKKLIHTYFKSLEQYNRSHDRSFAPQIYDISLKEHGFDLGSVNDFKKYLDSYFLTELLNEKFPNKNSEKNLPKKKI